MKTPEEVKKGLELCCEGMCSKCPYREECDEHLACGGEMLPADVVLNDIATYIQQLEAAAPKWISVEERLPEKDVRVAVLYRFPRSNLLFATTLDYFATDPIPHFQHTLGEGGPIVVYWMPLPEPPEEDT